MKPERIECIHNWIDDPVEFEREASSEGEGTSAPAPGPLILSAGRFSPEKGYEVLVQVAQLVKNRHPDWQWHLFGDGEEFGRIQAEVERLQLQDFLLLKGRADDLDQRYGQYALFVLTSYREGMPLVLLEAKQHRVPMVSFDCVTGPQEIITDGGDGFLIPPGDIEKMADAICILIERPELRAEMGAFQGGKIESFRKPAVLAQWIRQIEGPQGIV